MNSVKSGLQPTLPRLLSSAQLSFTDTVAVSAKALLAFTPYNTGHFSWPVRRGSSFFFFFFLPQTSPWKRDDYSQTWDRTELIPSIPNTPFLRYFRDCGLWTNGIWVYMHFRNVLLSCVCVTSHNSDCTLRLGSDHGNSQKQRSCTDRKLDKMYRWWLMTSFFLHPAYDNVNFFSCCC